MFIDKILRYFIGGIRFRVVNGFSERLINLCADNNINMWDFEKTTVGFNATVTANSYKKVVEYAKKSNVEIEIVSKKGFWFKAKKYNKRLGLVIGSILSLVFLIGMQNIVWEIEVIGNQKVSTNTILTQLEKLGVEQFTLITGIDFQNIKQEALLNLPQLSWLTINRDGCKLTVQVTERHLAPELEDSYPCDIVASKTGLILYMEVYAGETLVKVNHTVRQGEKLVSGVMESELLDIVTKVHANAKIIAQVQFDKTLGIDINHLSKEYTGKVETRRFFTFFDALTIPLFIADNDDTPYDITTCHEYFEFFSLKLPIGLTTATYNYYNKEEKEMTLQEATEILEDSFYLYEQTELSDLAILDRNITKWQDGDILYVKIDYTAEENIAKKVALIDEYI